MNGELEIGKGSIMTSRADKGKELVVARKVFKRLRKGVASSLSSQKAPPTRRFAAKVVEEHGLKWFNAQKEAKYSLENWIDEGRLAFELPHHLRHHLRVGTGCQVFQCIPWHASGGPRDVLHDA
ncbi:hypothetical protein HAX54_031278 [Datura stramonium]|uniref:Uncharacterized protein n=1 Tax=Datura stramonium TaxID=4076 RepID=A0ABS8V8Z1_DATST|nr:hypothetical protein [Datura stramonium]